MDIIKTIIPLGSALLNQPDTLPLSFLFHINKNILELVGTDHTKDYANIQIMEVEKLFQQFTNDYGVKNTAVVIDGRYSAIPDGVSKEECIKIFGEQGYAGYLAKKAGVAFLSIEPSFESIKDTTLNTLMIKPELLSSWAFLNFLSYFIQSNDTFPENCGAQIEEVLGSFSKYYGMDGDISSIFKSLRKIIATQSNILFPETVDGFSHYSIARGELVNAQKPNINGTLIQNAGAELNRARDYGILSNILKLQETYKCIFAVLGWNHVVSEIPAFLEIGYKEKAATY